MVRWLRYELSEAAQADLVVAAATVNRRVAALGTDAALRVLLRRETLRLGARSTHRRLRRQWRQSRLLLRGLRLSDLGLTGRLHADTLADTAPARSRRLRVRAFRRELISHVRRTRRLRPSPEQIESLLSYVRTRSGIAIERRLRAPTAGALPADEQLAAWKDLLTWFRDHFPYNRAACSACGEHGELLGNVAATPREASYRASRTELQHCGACGVVGRFPRYNDVAQILRTRQGRCGEYAQTLFQLVRALGWPARLVIDWEDHLWVEALLPVRADGGTRWVHMDPCEAAVDEPMLYASWGKNHTYLVGIGNDGSITDVTNTYARDVDETVRRRELSPDELRRALARARLVCKAPR